MNARCRRENRAAEQLKTPISVHPLKSHCALLDSCAWGGQLWGHKYDISTSRYLFSFFSGIAVTFSVFTALPARGRRVSCGDALFTQTCKTKLSARIWALFSLQTRQGFLVYCLTLHIKSLPHAKHTAPELHSADPWRKEYTS